MLENNSVTFESYRHLPGYIINLDKDRLRYWETRTRLVTLGFTNIHRREAVDFRKEDVNREIRRMGVGHLERFHNDAEIACALSHIKVMNHFLASKEEYCLVFEDDLIAHPNFKNLSSFDDINYGEFDVLMFGGVFVSYTKNEEKIFNLTELKKAQNKQTHVDNANFWQTHAYLASREFAYKVVSRYRDWTGTEEYRYPQLDNYISGAPWFKTKLICDQSSAEKHRYRLHNEFAHNLCGILFQDNNLPSNIQSY